MKENIFSEPYKLLSTADLLDIIDKANDYQPQAVEAAQLELTARQLTGEEFNEARAELDSRRQRVFDKQQKYKEIKNKIISIGTDVADTFHPIQKDTPTIDKLILFISLFFGACFLYELFTSFNFFIFIFSDDFSGWDWSVPVYFFFLFFPLVAGLLFWLRKHSGWILVTIYSFYNVISSILFLTSPRFELTGVAALDILIPPESPATHITPLILFSGLIWILFHERTRKVYRVETTTVIIIGGIGMIALMYFLFE